MVCAAADDPASPAHTPHGAIQRTSTKSRPDGPNALCAIEPRNRGGCCLSWGPSLSSRLATASNSKHVSGLGLISTLPASHASRGGQVTWLAIWAASTHTQSLTQAGIWALGLGVWGLGLATCFWFLNGSLLELLPGSDSSKPPSAGIRAELAAGARAGLLAMEHPPSLRTTCTTPLPGLGRSTLCKPDNNISDFT